MVPLTLSSTELRSEPSLNSYRCRTRAYQHACDMDTALDTYLHLKAANATEALRRALLVVPAGCVVVEVERLDG